MKKNPVFVNWIPANIVVYDEYGLETRAYIRAGQQYIVARGVSDLTDRIGSALGGIPIYEQTVHVEVVDTHTNERKPFIGLPEPEDGVYHILPYSMRLHPGVIERSKRYGDVLFLYTPDVDNDNTDIMTLHTRGFLRLHPMQKEVSHA